MRLAICTLCRISSITTITASTSFPSILLLLFLFNTVAATDNRAEKVHECCESYNVPDICTRTLCYPLRPPGDFDVYDIFKKKNDCSSFLPEIAQCLADGRDHLHCCKNEAKDYEENACFGLCEGVGKTRKSWAQYQTCLAINLPSMFLCMQKGYAKTPTPPRHLHLEHIETTSVLIRWEEPERNADQVQNYRIVITEQIEAIIMPGRELDEYIEIESENEDEQEEKEEDVDPAMPLFFTGHAPKRIEVEIGRQTHAKVDHLQPGTLYNAFVIAIGSEPKERSLSSDMLDFQTIGIAPEIRAYKRNVGAPIGAKNALLACRFHMSSVSYKTAKIQWQYKSPDSLNFKTIQDNERYNSSQYTWFYDHPKEYIMMLEVRRVVNSDFGLYRCSVSDIYGSGSAEVEFKLAELDLPKPRPPASPMDCCASRGVDKRCMSMCGGIEGQELKRYIPRPFMPINCSVQISKVLSCAMPGIDDSACCLMKKVPRACIYLCDSGVAPENHMNPLCLQFTLSVESCRVSGVERRPSPVTGLKAHTVLGTGSTSVEWDESTNTEVYHVYWKRVVDPDWQQKTVLGSTKKVLTGAEEVILVAANVYGVSQSSRLTMNNSRWTLA